MNLAQVIVKPKISEKTQKEEGLGKYVFIVNGSADKANIKRAVNELYEVTPVNVSIINFARKKKRNLKGENGRRFKFYPKVKKAIVTLKKGETINLIETKEK